MSLHECFIVNVSSYFLLQKNNVVLLDDKKKLLIILEKRFQVGKKSFPIKIK